MTACQSPLDLTSSSITPPPSIGTAGIQFGALMTNNSSPSRNLLPANAASAEALSKLRSNCKYLCYITLKKLINQYLRKQINGGN